MFVAGIAPEEGFVFNPALKEDQGPYIEYLLREKHYLVIKDCSIDTLESR